MGLPIPPEPPKGCPDCCADLPDSIYAGFVGSDFISGYGTINRSEYWDCIFEGLVPTLLGGWIWMTVTFCLIGGQAWISAGYPVYEQCHNCGVFGFPCESFGCLTDLGCYYTANI